MFKYFSNCPTLVGRPVAERVRRLVKSRINFLEGLGYGVSDIQHCLRVRHEVDSINLLGMCQKSPWAREVSFCLDYIFGAGQLLRRQSGEEDDEIFFWGRPRLVTR